MADVLQTLHQRFADAIAQACGEGHRDVNPLISASTNPKFGDYQANLAMSLAKQLGQKPRDVATKLVEALNVSDICLPPEIAGPGFINLKLRDDYLSAAANELHHDPNLGVRHAASPQTVVVDYSSPNVAKEMHVGHLRSTVIGDAISRVLECQGHRVIRQNHLGDWGTQFGMLIEYMLDAGSTNDTQGMSDLDAYYRAAKMKFDADAEFATRARKRVVALQAGDAQTLDLWKQLVQESYSYFSAIYARLNVKLTAADVRGESFYNDALSKVIADLDAAGALKESEGAKVVFPDGFADREGNALPMIVRKGDGGYLYATTDLAAARYRVSELHADRIIYTTDARQGQHFAMVFQTLRQLGWAPPTVRLDFVAFGTILGTNGKPFKTREGGTVKLVSLLDEAQQRASALVAEKNPDLPVEQRDAIAQAVGIGALKYGDLSSDRIKDYVFDWDRMLAFDGNTAPYLQYAYVRIRAIFRKGGIDPALLNDASITLTEQAERALALKLLQLSSVVDSVAESLEPHRLCTYLYELASTFHQFFEHCPVLKAESDAVRTSRLALCDVTARTLRQGLGLLGIDVVEQM